jgi:cytochrome c-type biogenesis protein CcmH
VADSSILVAGAGFGLFRRILIALIAAFLAVPSLSAEGTLAQPLGDPAVEARVNRLAADLRCLTCMGQSIADSQSSFSTDMKREIRVMVVNGKNDIEIMDFMVQRYGDFVLYRPPVKNTTWLLWGGPFVLLVIALGFLIARLRKRSGQISDSLSESEHRQATNLLGRRDGNGS